MKFVRNCHTFPKWLHHVTSPQRWMGVPVTPTSSPAFDVVSVPDCGHSDRCLVVSHCFSLHFLDEVGCGASFQMLISHPYIFFGEVFGLVFWAVFLLSFKSSLYILAKSPLSALLQIFSPVACLLILFTLFFHRAEVFNFSEVYLILPLVFYLKHHFTRVRLGFLLCRLLGIL